MAVPRYLFDRLLQLLVGGHEPAHRERSADGPLRQLEQVRRPLRLDDHQGVWSAELVVDELAAASLPLSADLVLGPPQAKDEQWVDDLRAYVGLRERLSQQKLGRDFKGCA